MVRVREGDGVGEEGRDGVVYNHFETARKRTVAHTRDTRRVTRMGQERTRDGTTTRARWIWVRLLPLKSRDGMFGPVANPFVPPSKDLRSSLGLFRPSRSLFLFRRFSGKNGLGRYPHPSLTLARSFPQRQGRKIFNHSFISFIPLLFQFQRSKSKLPSGG